MEPLTTRRAMALGTAATRKRNGFCTARFGIVWMWTTRYEGVHVVNSAYVPIGERFQ